MQERTARGLAWLAFAIIVVSFLSNFALGFLSRSATGGYGGPSNIANTLFMFAMFSFPLVGILIASRRPRNTIAWILLATGAAWNLPFDSYAFYGLVANPGSVPAPDLAAALASPGWVPAIGLPGTFLILLFPDGRLPSRRWKPLVWLSAIALTLSWLVIMAMPGQLEVEGLPPLTNPLGIEALRPILEPMVFVIVLIPICIVGCAVSLVQRFRRSRGAERLQLKWLTSAAGVVAIMYLTAMMFSLPLMRGEESEPTWLRLMSHVTVFSFTLIPVATGIAILRHRLFDIDVVIKKTVVFAALAGFITVVYVAIVVGVGNLVGSADEPDLGLSVAATALVAVAFQPVRERLEHLANRLVYGRRATPYEVLSEFSEQVAETYATEDVLPRMARAIKGGVAADRATVWLRTGTELRPAASFPPYEAGPPPPLPLTSGELPTVPGVDRAIEVRHQGQLLGALSVNKAPADPLTPAEEKLLADLAAQAGLVLRNVGLTAELLARLDELQESRKRLVAAQDHERRRIERDLHDGAQQYLVALKTRLSLAKKVGERDADRAVGLIAELEELADETLETLRELARGIYPPLLADQGLYAALEAKARRAVVPVEVRADGITRYSQEVEAAAYFCCLEALQNASKYAHASRVTIRLWEEDGVLVFSVEDDGQGFDPASARRGTGTQNMLDRVDALGGTIGVRSAPGQGTTIEGRIPTRPWTGAITGGPPQRPG
ncbi:MAG: sensor histidine kinase [Actinomycetota bacterium]|nr:sensor histidine kinase [Actinomycetota bacterium]